MGTYAEELFEGREPNPIFARPEQNLCPDCDMPLSPGKGRTLEVEDDERRPKPAPRQAPTARDFSDGGASVEFVRVPPPNIPTNSINFIALDPVSRPLPDLDRRDKRPKHTQKCTYDYTHIGPYRAGD